MDRQTEDTDASSYFLFPTNPSLPQPDGVLSGLLSVTELALTHHEPGVRALAEAVQRQVHTVQQDIRRKLLVQQAKLSTQSLRLLIEQIAYALGVDSDELRSRKRTQHIATQRKIAMVLARRISKASFPRLAQAFGRDNHTTVISAVRSIERRMGDPAFRQMIETLEAEITSAATGTTAEAAV
jgi:chromosomal replication initiator protein